MFLFFFSFSVSTFKIPFSSFSKDLGVVKNHGNIEIGLSEGKFVETIWGKIGGNVGNIYGAGVVLKIPSRKLGKGLVCSLFDDWGIIGNG